MATIGSSYLNLIDYLKLTEAGDKIATVIEILKQQNSILDDAVAMECNKGAIHRHTIRSGLGSVAWGRLYQGIPQSKGSVQQVDDTTGWLECLSSVDVRLLGMSKNAAQMRLNEATSFLEAMNQEMATGIFYHDTATTPERFKGLAARFGTLGGSGAGNQIVDGGGTGSDNTSIWGVTWGDMYTHLLYPEGTTAGITREDMAQQRVLDLSGNPYFVQEEKFEWHMGLAVKDFRYNFRLANIDVSNLQAGTVDLYKLLRKAYYKLQSRRVSGGRQAIYCNVDVLEALDGLASNHGATDSFVRLRPMEIEGKEVLTYRGIPIRECQAILNTEQRVV